MTVLPRHEEEARKWLEEMMSFYDDDEEGDARASLAAIIAAAEEQIWERAAKVCEEFAVGKYAAPLHRAAAAIRAAKEEG